MENHNNVTEFILMGLFMKIEMKIFCFAFFMACYIAIFLGNFIVFVTIVYSHLIQKPMYYFLCHLSFIDTCFTSTTAPRLISDLIASSKAISYNACMTQLFAFHIFGGMEILLLVVMAFDRYVAICKPLHYMIIINRQRCTMLIMLIWLVSFWHSVAQLFLILRLPFCGPNQIDHFICDSKALLKLVCTDTHEASILVIANTGMVVLTPFLVLVTSYVIILYHLRSHSAEGRRKALSTCGSHVMVVFLFFIPCVSTYILPPNSKDNDKEFSVFYAMIAPMLNPLIYTLRNAEMKNAMRKVWCQKLALLLK